MTPRSVEARRAECGMTHAEIRDAATATRLLCNRCNRLLGQAGDDPGLLRRLAEYVEGVMP